jgi:hypothetical protein
MGVGIPCVRHEKLSGLPLPEKACWSMLRESGDAMVKVVERKLGRERAAGLAWGDQTIEIDPRQAPRSYLGTAIHELLHQVFPEKSETAIRRGTATMTGVLWQLGYRRFGSSPGSSAKRGVAGGTGRGRLVRPPRRKG